LRALPKRAAPSGPPVLVNAWRTPLATPLCSAAIWLRAADAAGAKASPMPRPSTAIQVAVKAVPVRRVVLAPSRQATPITAKPRPLTSLGPILLVSRAAGRAPSISPPIIGRGLKPLPIGLI